MSASSDALEKRRRGRGMISNHDGSAAVDDGERLGITVNGPVPPPQPVLGDLAPPFHCSTDPPNTLRIPNSRSVRTPPIRWAGWIVEAIATPPRQRRFWQVRPAPI